LPSINIDYYQAGQLMVECLIARGHRSIGLLLASPDRAGNENFLNGVLTGLHAANPLPVALHTRFYPGSEEGFVVQVKNLLSMPNRPSAVIVGGEAMAKWVGTIAADLGLSIPDQLDMSYVSEGCAGIDRLSCPRVEPQKPVLQIVTQAVEMLWQLSQGIALKEDTVMVPVSLHGTDPGYGTIVEKEVQQQEVALQVPKERTRRQRSPERRQ
jgi:DNA-binding LacI/PurR family transcriptional regulator